MPDVFVSYSRRDSEFVRRLADSVSERGKEVWLDTEGIADAEVFPEAIKRAIEQSDAFVFVITPASVQSAYCENEVDYAREMQKRIVPVLRDPVPDGELPRESATATGSRSPTTRSLARRWGGWSTRLTPTSTAPARTPAGWSRRWNGTPRVAIRVPAARLGAQVGRGLAGGQPRGHRPGAHGRPARVPARQP